MTLLSNACCPNYLLSANPDVVLDAQYSDFEEQAERLTGFDQSYLQLSPGPFTGRFLSCVFSPEMSIHIEHCNQALEQSIAGHPRAFVICTLVNNSEPFRLNGADFSSSDVMIFAPGTDLFVRSPEDGAVLALVIHEDKLIQQTGLTDAARDWLLTKDFGVKVLRAPQFARRMREDTVQALQSTGLKDQSPAAISAIGDALLSGFAAKLSLELAGSRNLQSLLGSAGYDRFLYCRQAIHGHWQDITSVGDLLSITGSARRSLQKSFASQIDVGPLAYHRILRLHLARVALRDPQKFDASIGDIAARFEFWNWSQFTQQYQKHFGELPSRTRHQAGFEK